MTPNQLLAFLLMVPSADYFILMLWHMAGGEHLLKQKIRKHSFSPHGCHLVYTQEIRAILRTVPRGASYHLGVKGTEHFNFSDYAVYFSPARALGLLGPIDGVRGLQITRTYVRAFFDTYLNKTPSPLLWGPTSDYPEVQFSPP